MTKVSVSYFAFTKKFNLEEACKKIILSGLLLIEHLFKALYFARYQWHFFMNLLDMEILAQVMYKLLPNWNRFYDLFIRIFFLFLQGEPLKPSSGEYSK